MKRYKKIEESKSWLKVYLKKSLEAWPPPWTNLGILNLQKKLGEKSTSLEKQCIQCKPNYKKEPKAKSKKKYRETRAKQELEAKNERWKQ